MKIGNLLLLVLVGLVLNPRVNLVKGEKTPRSVVSCSTGWSLYWGEGLVGIYSLDTAAQMLSSSGGGSSRAGRANKTSRSKSYQLARDNILQNCK